MDSDHDQYANGSSISTQDWNLIWGNSSEAPRFRGAADVGEDTAPMEIRMPPNKQFEQQSEDRRNPLQLSLQEVDPCFLTRFVLFTQVALPMVFQFVLDFVAENEQTNGNFEADGARYAVRGGLFDETRFVEYTLKLFTHRGQLGLSLDILDGYPPAVQTFWNELQQALQENQFTECQEEEDSDAEEYNFDESDDENDDFTLDLEQEKFLNLGEDPELVDQWFQDLNDPNFMQQTLLLLAWNCQDAQNFQAVTGKNQAQQLFDLIITCMIAATADFCLPIARCASLLVSQLVDAHDIKVTEEQFNVLVQTLVQWTISQQSEQTESKLTSSKEVASILSSQMSKMAPLAVNWKDTLQQVYTQAPYECVRANLQKVVRTY